MLPFSLSLAEPTSSTTTDTAPATPPTDLIAALERIGTGTCTTADADTLRTALADLQRQVDAARAFAAEMADYCSPHNVAALYAQRLTERIDAATPQPSTRT
ncbi:hypothetical protein [Kitasatospora sp. NPDC004272]